MRGNAVLEGKKAPQPVELDLAPFGHADPVFGATGHTREGHQRQLPQRVAAGPTALVVAFGDRAQVAQGRRRIRRLRVIRHRGQTKPALVAPFHAAASCNRPGGRAEPHE